MAITLTPDQQAKLEQFELDAAAAVAANVEADATASQLATLNARAEHLKQVQIDDMAAALASAKAFVDAMLGKPTPAPTPVSGSSPK